MFARIGKVVLLAGINLALNQYPTDAGQVADKLKGPVTDAGATVGLILERTLKELALSGGMLVSLYKGMRSH